MRVRVDSDDCRSGSYGSPGHPPRRLVIFGAGGFGREVLTAARGCNVVLAADDASDTLLAPRDISEADDVVIAISDTAIRRRIACRPYRFGRVVAPTSVIGAEVTIGDGSIFCDFTMATHSARIGRHFHCNIYSYVAHDCVIGDFVTFAPKVCCNGNVQIHDGVFVGAGAILRNGKPRRPLVIGEGAVIGCGAVVTKDVQPFAVVVGNPAEPLVRAPVVRIGSGMINYGE